MDPSLFTKFSNKTVDEYGYYILNNEIQEISVESFILSHSLNDNLYAYMLGEKMSEIFYLYRKEIDTLQESLQKYIYFHLPFHLVKQFRNKWIYLWIEENKKRNNIFSNSIYRYIIINHLKDNFTIETYFNNYILRIENYEHCRIKYIEEFDEKGNKHGIEEYKPKFGKYSKIWDHGNLIEEKRSNYHLYKVENKTIEEYKNKGGAVIRKIVKDTNGGKTITEFWTSGKVEKYEYFLNDKLEGRVEEWTSDGFLHYYCDYKNGLKDGESKSYCFHTRKFIFSMKYKNGLKHGTYLEYHTGNYYNGKLSYFGRYENGIPVGEHISGEASVHKGYLGSPYNGYGILVFHCENGERKNGWRWYPINNYEQDFLRLYEQGIIKERYDLISKE